VLMAALSALALIRLRARNSQTFLVYDRRRAGEGDGSGSGSTG